MESDKRLELPPRDYQPSAAELREKIDMPGADMDTLRRAFFQPVKVVEKQEPHQ